MGLAEKLTALRRDKGLTQIEVAEELNVSRQAVSKWEVGDTVPSTANLKYLARLYEVPLEYLFDEDATILLYIKVFEKSGNLPNTNQTTEIKEGSIELNPGGGFDLEW